MKILLSLLDLEKDLRDAEGCLSAGLKCLSWSKNEGWFDLMIELGFIVDNKFLPLLDIIEKTRNEPEPIRTAMLEAVGCDLSLVAAITESNYEI